MGIVAALDPHLPNWLHVPLRFYVGISGAFILLLAAATSLSGFGRLAYSLGEHGQLPRAFGRLHRRTLVSPQAVVRGGRHLGRDHHRRLAARTALLVPREPLQLRRPARVHRRAARRDPAAANRSGPPPPVQGSVQRQRSRGRGSRPVGDRCDLDVRRLDRGAGDAPGRALRRAGLAPHRTRRLRVRAPRARRGTASSTSCRPTSRSCRRRRSRASWCR